MPFPDTQMLLRSERMDCRPAGNSSVPSYDRLERAGVGIEHIPD
jgi:hypothetical protein